MKYLPLLLILLLPTRALAHNREPSSLLHAANVAYWAAVAADDATTAIGLHRGAVEGSPLFAWTGTTSGVLAANTGFSLGVQWAVHHWVAPRHPRIAAALLTVKTGLHLRATVHNIDVARTICQGICVHPTF